MKPLSKQKTLFLIIALSVTCCIIMAMIELMVHPTYFVKSGYKLIVFLAVPFLFSFAQRDLNLLDCFKIKSKRQFLKALLLGITVYVLILSVYFLIRQFIDLDNIKALLERNLNVTKDNFVYVSLYISFFNSLLEEFFFRGFVFLSMKKQGFPLYATLFSSLLFAIYHIAIMASWFSVWLFLLLILGLFVSGLFFNQIDSKHENIYPSWMVHIFANFSINTIGFIMFGIL